MTGQTNTGGGSIGAQRKGTIVVSYPEDSVCTVTGNGQTYTALDTSGAAAFIVEPGTWTVTATPAGGGTPASQSVTVTAGGWVEVELTFNLVIYANGTLAEIAGGLEVGYIEGNAPVIELTPSLRIAAPDSATGAAATIRTKNKIPLSTYKTLKIEISELYILYNSNTRYFNFMLSSSATEIYSGGIVSEKIYGTSTAPLTVTLDISQLTDSDGYYFGVGMYSHAHAMYVVADSIIAYP